MRTAPQRTSEWRKCVRAIYVQFYDYCIGYMRDRCVLKRALSSLIYVPMLVGDCVRVSEGAHTFVLATDDCDDCGVYVAKSCIICDTHLP